MAKLTISEAARQVPISRKTLYKNYIQTGKISVEQDEKGNPKIDSSELVRVFPGLQGKQVKLTEGDGNFTQGNNLGTAILEERIKSLEALLAEKEKTMAVKDELISSQKQQLLLLGFDKPKRRFWWFGKKE